MRIRTQRSSRSITKKDFRTAELASALAHPVRVALVRYLSEKNCGKGVDNVTCNKDIVEMFEYSQSTISQHVQMLKRSGLVITENKDKFTLYYLNRELLLEFSNTIHVLCKSSENQSKERSGKSGAL